MASVTGVVILSHSISGVIPVYTDGGAPADSYLLMQTSDFLLLQTGDYIILN